MFYSTGSTRARDRPRADRRPPMAQPEVPVRFCYAESMTDPSFYAPLARAAEDAGYDSMVIDRKSVV